MSVKIRLTRVGATHAPFHRVVVMDSRKKRDGAFLANIGTYNAVESKVVTFDVALYDEWTSKGAIPTDSAKKIYKQVKREAVKAEAKPAAKKAAPKKSAAKKVVDKAEAKKEAPKKAAAKVETKPVEKKEAKAEAQAKEEKTAAPKA